MHKNVGSKAVFRRDFARKSPQTGIIAGTYPRFRTIGNFFIPLLLALIIGFSASNPPVNAQSTPTATGSLIDYRPEAKDFPKQLAAGIRDLQKGIDLKKNKKIKESQVQLSAAVSKTTTLLKTLSRGYHDELLLLRGYAQELQGQEEKALADYQRALTQRSGNPLVLIRKAVVLKRLKRCSDAVPVLEEVLWLTKTAQHEVLDLSAACQIELGNKDKAMTLLKQARALNPHYLPLLLRVVELQQEQLALDSLPAQKRNLLEAEITTDLWTITRLDPTNRDAALRLGKLLLKTSDPLINADRINEAGALAKRFAEQSSYKDSQIVRLLFDAQIQRRNVKGAKETLAKGLQAVPESQTLKEAQMQLELEDTLNNEQSSEGQAG